MEKKILLYWKAQVQLSGQTTNQVTDKGNLNYSHCIQNEKVNPKFKCGRITFKGITDNWIWYFDHVPC